MRRKLMAVARSAATVLALAVLHACTGAQPCSSGGPGLRLRIDIPCCDAHDAEATVRWPSGDMVTYAIDTTNVGLGGTATLVAAYPEGVSAGSASIDFYAIGDGTQSWGADATVNVDPSKCADVQMTAVSSFPPDAGPLDAGP